MFWLGKRPLFQPLGQHPDTRAVLADDLDSRVPPVAEDKQRALFQIFTQAFGHQGVQAIETFAHVAGFYRHEHLQAARKT